MSTLKARLTNDMKTAMKSGEKNLLGVIRLINAAIKQREVDERILLDDAQVIAAIEKMIKQRKDSISQYLAAARTDLADVEQYELGVLQTYLPAQLASAEVEAIVAAAISATGAASAKDMGKVIALVKPQLAGRADMGKVSDLIKQKLAAR
ncbi:MAG: glutamyl-tRNA amidotransferase [Lysobacterales bacterium CG02_land_8_20_14_3_00_62_12]|nr:MAG: glutamyl-tRNA amidotransferase [Xanthomonadales bacterium CG02_land_8_20_14_3_00_62_12]PJA39622.1 MAG: glutamyl-tRNA amidotransferase [Xanthomonadales bacterium CG_4_9_14_3_um_filter_62_6]